MVTEEVEEVEEGGIVVALGGMTMDTGGPQGGHHHRIEVAVITLQGGHRHHTEVVVVVGGITLLGGHLTMVGDQGGSEHGLLLIPHLTGVPKGTMLVARMLS